MTRAAIVIALSLAVSCASDELESAALAGTGGGGAGGQGGNAAVGAAAGTTAGSAGSAGSAGTGMSGAMAVASGGVGGMNAGAGGSDASVDAAMQSDSALPMGDGGSSWATRELSPGPSYMGSGGGGCNTSYGSIGHAPIDAANGKHPLFLYFVGTSFSDADESSQYTSPAALKVTEAMARRGFVALSVDYDNGLSLDLNKTACLYDGAKPQSMLAIACALPEVDCELGIATWGHSQGALMAHSASVYDDRVRASWTTGYGGSTTPLPASRFRVVNGENDTMNAAVAKLNETAGFTPTECPDDGRSECLRDDGSGWIIVREAASETNSADHCWFDKASCISNAISLEPAWVDPTSTAAFALEANADWVAATTARP